MSKNAERIVLDSKLIEYMIYDKAESTLEVKYKSGHYKGQSKTYKDFDPGAFDYIVNHESPGKALKSVLKKREKEFESKSIFHKILSKLPFF